MYKKKGTGETSKSAKGGGANQGESWFLPRKLEGAQLGPLAKVKQEKVVKRK